MGRKKRRVKKTEFLAKLAFQHNLMLLFTCIMMISACVYLIFFVPTEVIELQATLSKGTRYWSSSDRSTPAWMYDFETKEYPGIAFSINGRTVGSIDIKQYDNALQCKALVTLHVIPSEAIGKADFGLLDLKNKDLDVIGMKIQGGKTILDVQETQTKREIELWVWKIMLTVLTPVCLMMLKVFRKDMRGQSAWFILKSYFPARGSNSKDRKDSHKP